MYHEACHEIGCAKLPLTTSPSEHRVDVNIGHRTTSSCRAPPKSAKSAPERSVRAPHLPRPHGVTSWPFASNLKPRACPQRASFVASTRKASSCEARDAVSLLSSDHGSRVAEHSNGAAEAFATT